MKMEGGRGIGRGIGREKGGRDGGKEDERVTYLWTVSNSLLNLQNKAHRDTDTSQHIPEKLHPYILNVSGDVMSSNDGSA